MIKLPMVYNSDLTFVRFLHPIRGSITLNATPLSYASVEVQKGDGLKSRQIVEMFTPYGTAGFYRVCVPSDTYGNATTASQMEHAISEVGDYLVKEEVSEMMSATKAMKKVFSHYAGKLWQLGSVSALGTDDVAVDVNYDRVLDAMLAILEQRTDCMMAFDYSTKPWTIKIVKKSETVNAEGRLSRNLISARVSYDDSELCTRAYYKTYKTDKKGNVTEKWKHKDANVSKYGVVEREVSTSSDMTDEEISTAVNTYLNEHKQPKFSVEISAEELSQITGESLDKFELGKLMRLAIPDYGVVIEEHINSITWSDVYNAPELMTVKLGDDEDTVVSFLHKVDANTVSSGKSGTSVKKSKLYETKIDQTDKLIDLYAQRLDEHGNILQQAGMDINADGVLIYATDNQRNIAAMLQTQADRIDLVVEGTGPNAKIKPASIVAAINNGKSSVAIDGDHVRIGSGGSTISLDGAFTVNNGNLTVKKNLYMDWGNSHSKIYTQGGVSFVGASGSQGVRSYDLNYTVLGEMVKSATLDGEVLTLEKFSGEIINFDRAAAYRDGWRAAVEKISLPDTNMSSKNFLISVPPSTVDGSAETYRYTVVDNGNNAIRVNNVDASGTVLKIVAAYTHNKYNAGWGAAYGKQTLPGSNTSSGNFIVYTAPSDVGGSAEANRYSMVDHSKNVARVNHVDANGTVIKTIASLTHNRYNGGWGAAVAKQSLPGTNTSSGSFIVYTAPSTVDGSAEANRYRMAAGTDSVLVNNVNSSGTVLKTIAKYNLDIGEIDLGSVARYSAEPSGTALSTLRNEIITAQGTSRGQWVRFKVSINVDGTTHEKWYKLNFTA